LANADDLAFLQWRILLGNELHHGFKQRVVAGDILEIELAFMFVEHQRGSKENIGFGEQDVHHGSTSNDPVGLPCPSIEVELFKLQVVEVVVFCIQVS